MNTFDPNTHEYRSDDRLIGSTTQILRAVGLYSDYGFAAGHHRYRGSAVHHGCALIDMQGAVPTITAPAHLRQVADEITNGYWPAFEHWKARTKWQGICWECSLILPGFFGGTFDAIGRFGDDPCLVLADIKSGVLPALVPAQLASYMDLIRRGTPIDPEHPGWEFVQENIRSGVPVKRIAVRLEKNGTDTMFSSTAKGESYDAPMWDALWRSVLNVYIAKANYGLLAQEERS